MTPANFILASLRHHRRMHVAVGLGVAMATAVLTGALLVGDSVRGSLRDLTLQRLGRIDSALVTGHFFRDALADEVHGEPAILMPGTLEAGSGDDTRRATQVSIVGVRDEFWKLGQTAGRRSRSRRATWRSPNRSRGSSVSRQATRFCCGFPRRKRFRPTVRSARRTTRRGDGGCAWRKCCRSKASRGLRLQPSQQLPRNVFVPLATLAEHARTAGTGERDSRGRRGEPGEVASRS